MTTRLEQAFAEAAKLPDDDKDAIASRLLAEVEDERKWAAPLRRDDRRPVGSHRRGSAQGRRDGGASPAR